MYLRDKKTLDVETQFGLARIAVLLAMWVAQLALFWSGIDPL
jgi:hypothetical protein